MRPWIIAGLFAGGLGLGLGGAYGFVAPLARVPTYPLETPLLPNTAVLHGTILAFDRGTKTLVLSTRDPYDGHLVRLTLTIDTTTRFFDARTGSQPVKIEQVTPTSVLNIRARIIASFTESGLMAASITTYPKPAYPS